jgi:hypothetical protein
MMARVDIVAMTAIPETASEVLSRPQAKPARIHDLADPEPSRFDVAGDEGRSVVAGVA